MRFILRMGNAKCVTVHKTFAMKNKLLGLMTIGALVTSPVAIVFGNQYPAHAESYHPTCIGILTASNPNARITLRSGPGVNYRSLGYGLVNDRVKLLATYPPEPDLAEDGQGYNWYRVHFPVSSAKGWIREDLLRLQCRDVPDL